jgi:hypothetical protein
MSKRYTLASSGDGGRSTPFVKPVVHDFYGEGYLWKIAHHDHFDHGIALALSFWCTAEISWC